MQAAQSLLARCFPPHYTDAQAIVASCPEAEVVVQVGRDRPHVTGRVLVTSNSLLLEAATPSDNVEIPLHAILEAKYEQPIFSSTKLVGTMRLGEGEGEGDETARWEIRFTKGHSDPFARLFMRAWNAARSIPVMAEASAPELPLAEAMLDPSS